MHPRIFFFLLLLAGFSACQHEPLNPPVNPQDGSLPDCRLLTSQQGIRQFVYQYDSLERLSSRLELWNGILRVWHVLRYAGDRLVAREQWTAYAPGTPVFASYDTLLYNPAGQISEVRTLQPGKGFSEYVIETYEYNTSGQPVKSRTYYPADGNFLLSHQYTWKNGNLVKREDYSGDFAQLLHEFFYEYTAGINPERMVTLFPEMPANQNRNLVKIMRATDYSGLLDLVCNPCQHEYELNNHLLPVRIRYGWDDEVAFEWDCQ